MTMLGVSMGRDDMADSPRMISRFICDGGTPTVEFRAIPRGYRNLILDVVGASQSGSDSQSVFSIFWNQLTFLNGSFVAETKSGYILSRSSTDAGTDDFGNYGPRGAIFPTAGDGTANEFRPMISRFIFYDYGVSQHSNRHPMVAVYGLEDAPFGSPSARFMMQTTVYRPAAVPFTNYATSPISSLQITTGTSSPWRFGSTMTLWGEP